MMTAKTKADTDMSIASRFIRRLPTAVGVLAAVSCLVLTGASRASDLPDTAAIQMPPVIVTAGRLPQLVLTAPLAYDILHPGSDSPHRGNGLNELLAAVPGVLAQSRSGSQDVRITIRGFGARGAGERSNAGTSRGVRILLDGFPETEPDGRTSFDLIDPAVYSSVEVVRSNASSLWGNASGGVVNISTIPDFTDPYLRTQASFGDFGFHKEVVTAGLFVGQAKLDIALVNSGFDGWRAHSTSSRKLLNLALASVLGPRTVLEVYLTAAANKFRIPGPLTRAQFATDPSRAQDDTLDFKPTYVQRDERRFNRLGRLGLRLEHQLNDRNGVTASVFVNPKYLQRSERNTFRDFTRIHFGGSVLYRNSARLGASCENVVMAGLDDAYQDGAILFYNLQDGRRGDTIASDKREGANNFGAFAENQLTIAERLVITLGARFDDVTYYYDDHLAPQLNARKSFTGLTPRVGVTYHIGAEDQLYAALGGGIEVPAGNETDPAGTDGLDTVTAINPLLDPIRSSTIEVGSRHTRSFGPDAPIEQVSCGGALYWITVRNDIVPYRGGRFYFTSGKTRRLGLELEVVASLRSGFDLQAALTIMRNRYVEYAIDSVHYGRPGAVADLADKEMAGLPELFYRVNLRYSPSFFSHLFGEVGAQGVGEYFADDLNSIAVSAYNLVNVRFGLNDVSLVRRKVSLSVAASVENLTDQRYAASVYINPDRGRISGAPVYLEPGLPRNLAITTSLKWNL